MRRTRFLPASLILLVGCIGNVEPAAHDGEQVPAAVSPAPAGTPRPTSGGPGAPGERVEPASAARPAGTGPSPGPSPLRRLTREEYNNTVEDLFGVTSRPADAFQTDARLAGFESNTEAPVTTVHARDYLAIAKALAAAATANLPERLACDPAARGETACLDELLAGLGKRIYRRPVTPAEAAILKKVFATARAGSNYVAGVRQVLTAMLIAPQFLYRDLGGPADAGVRAVDPYHLASRLSYLFTRSTPDAALMSAAESGALARPDALRAEVSRLLGHPRARRTVASLQRQWLRLDELENTAKDKKAYPAFTSEVRGLLQRETESFVEAVFWDEGAKLSTLFTAGFSMRNDKLALFYGSEGAGEKTWKRVELPAARRGGILTQGGVLAMLAGPDQSDPIARGKFVMEALLCKELPPPPAEVDAKPPTVTAETPTRERFARHSAEPACAACHQFLDAVGLSFEDFDGAGRHRTTDAGKPVDNRGRLAGSDVDGPFVGAPELGHKLAGSAQARSCAVKSFFRFAHGRPETPADEGSLARLGAALEASGGSTRTLLEALIETDAFRYRTVEVSP